MKAQRLFTPIAFFFVLLPIHAENSKTYRNAVTCSLDTLIELPECWKLSAENLETQFSYKKNLLFKWLTKEKTRAKFTRHLYGNREIDLSILEEKVPIMEDVLDFSEGKLNLLTFSIYNRGDAKKKINAAEFMKRYMAVGRFVSTGLKVKPYTRKPNRQQGLLTKGYIWSSPKAYALLEHNEGADTSTGEREFLRLRIAHPKAKSPLALAMRSSRGGAAVRKSELPRAIKKTPEGDIYIADLPMVDQGRKGYCVVAAAQRIFEHYGIGVDMHQLAEVAGSDPTKGTNNIAMARELDKIDYRFKTRLKIIGMGSIAGTFNKVKKQRDQYYVGKEIDKHKFLKSVKDHIDDGIPLLWSLNLGDFPEKPSLNPQASGGHMRIIIGYNEQTGKLIFTDSWGAGHEFKTMRIEHAYQATKGLFSLSPTVN